MLEHLVDLERAKEILQENFDKVFYEEIVGGARKKFGLVEALDGDQEWGQNEIITNDQKLIYIHTIM